MWAAIWVRTTDLPLTLMRNRSRSRSSPGGHSKKETKEEDKHGVGVGSPKWPEHAALRKLVILICHTARWLLYAQPKVNSQWQVESGSQAPAPKVNYRHARPPGFLPACRGRVVWKAAPNHMHSSHPEVISTVFKVADYLRPSSSLNLMSESQFEKVFLPPGTGFLRRNFPNIDDEFS